MPNPRSHDNLACASRCSNQWSAEHAYNSNLLARRLGHPRGRHAARGIAHGNRCDRMQRVLFAVQAMRITKTPKPVHGFIKQILGLSGTWMIQQAETGEIVIMPITHLAICKDCSANVGAIGEWCMLRNSVWQKVWPGTTQKSIHPGVRARPRAVQLSATATESLFNGVGEIDRFRR